MNPRLKSIAFAASLTFNAAVLCGFMAAGGVGGLGGMLPGPKGPPLGPGLDIDRAARILDLSPEQRQALEQVKMDRDRVFPAIDEEMQLLEGDLRRELGNESSDSVRVREILDRQAQLVFERRGAQADLFERFQQVLTPEQRRRLHEERQKHPHGPPMPPPPPVVRRFDRDGDGELNDAEREDAERELKDRRAMHDRPRGGPAGMGPGPGAGNGPGNGPGAGPGAGAPPLWVFFDQDDDGVLNEAERRERDEFVHSHHPSRAWRPGRGPADREAPEGPPSDQPAP